jgi:preprotein translocase subunit SecE
MINFLRDVKGEMKHVNWPTRKQTMIYSILVVVISLFVAAYVGAFDYIFTKIIEQITK